MWTCSYKEGPPKGMARPRDGHLDRLINKEGHHENLQEWNFYRRTPRNKVGISQVSFFIAVQVRNFIFSASVPKSIQDPFWTDEFYQDDKGHDKAYVTSLCGLVLLRLRKSVRLYLTVIFIHLAIDFHKKERSLKGNLFTSTTSDS